SGGTPFVAALKDVAYKLTRRAFEVNHIGPAEQMQMDKPESEVVWRDTGGYVARPLVAIWATAPYLHNGSVPTLDHLREPAKHRPVTFPVGHREYDPRKLGYVTDLDRVPESQRGLVFTLDTRVSGNCNTGHEYGTDLTEDQRRDLLEFLKKGPMPASN